MAKKRDYVDEVEKACRRAIQAIPGLKDLPETEYLNAIEEGLDPIMEGAKMRREELQAE